jgi:5-methyltetrahydropteroyltriglutamate--homocysteine methyltransferase
VDDPLYSQETTRRRLEETDKRLRASVAVTLFDKLIEAHLRREGLDSDIQQRLGEAWTEIRHGRVDPFTLMEDPALFRKRLTRVVERFGEERVPYAGPECGFGSWPTYETAMGCLRQISETVNEYNKENR